jgi:hypothetical protein
MGSGVILFKMSGGADAGCPDCAHCNKRIFCSEEGFFQCNKILRGQRNIKTKIL